jgi:hypothetical protein
MGAAKLTRVSIPTKLGEVLLGVLVAGKKLIVVVVAAAALLRWLFSRKQE